MTTKEAAEHFNLASCPRSHGPIQGQVVQGHATGLPEERGGEGVTLPPRVHAGAGGEHTLTQVHAARPHARSMRRESAARALAQVI